MYLKGRKTARCDSLRGSLHYCPWSQIVTLNGRAAIWGLCYRRRGSFNYNFYIIFGWLALHILPRHVNVTIQSMEHFTDVLDVLSSPSVAMHMPVCLSVYLYIKGICFRLWFFEFSYSEHNIHTKITCVHQCISLHRNNVVHVVRGSLII